MANRKLEKSVKKFSKKHEPILVTISGELGLALNGQKLVEVPSRKGFVYVRLRNNTSEVIQAYNSEVSTIYGLPVLVARANNIYKVIGRDLDRYRDWGSIPYLPKHGGQHSFNQQAGMGADIVWVYSSQFMPLLGYPSGTNGSDSLTIAPYLLRDPNGNWKYTGNTGTPSVTPYRPSTGTQAVMVLVYLDTVSGNPYLMVGSGSYFDATLTGTSDIYRYIPSLTNPNHIPITAIRLTSGTTQLFWGNLYDARPFFHVMPTGSAGGGTVNPPVTGSFVVQDEGVTLGSATTLNVVGTVADVSLVGTTARLFITGSTGGGGISSGTYLVTEDLTSQISGTNTRFTLSNAPDPVTTARLYYNGVRQRYLFNYTVSGSYVETLYTPTTGSVLTIDYNESSATGTLNGLIQVQDEGIVRGNVNTLNFVGANVQATVSGNLATVTVTGSSGSSAIYPQDIMLFAPQFKVITGTFTYQASTSETFDFEYYSTNNAAVLQTTLVLKAGTYDVSVLGIKVSSSGKLDWAMNGVNFISGQDWYNAGTQYNQTQTGTVVLASDGRYILTVTTNGKNASSSGFLQDWTYIKFSSQSQSSQT